MAGGKETPRQKMIGMMYLVLTALLALNVAKSVLDAFVAIEENVQEANLTELYRGNEKRDELKETSLDNSNPQRAKKAKKLLSIVEKIDKITAIRIEEIDKLKVKILEECGEDMKTIGKEGSILIKAYSKKDPVKPARMNLAFVDGKDKYDDPMRIMLGPDVDIKKPKGEGIKLWKSLNSYRKELTEMIASSQVVVDDNGNIAYDDKHSFKAPEINDFKSQKDLNAKIRKAIDKSNVHPDDKDNILEIYRGLTKAEFSEVHDESGVHWIGKTFDHAPSVAAIASLSSLQKDILSARAQALSLVRGRVGGGEFTFSRIIPLAYGPEVVNAGQEFTIEVLMAAYDADKQPEVTYNGTNIKEIKNGKGYVTLTGAGTQMELKGTVSIRNKSGQRKTMTWTKNVTVMKPSGSIELPEYNILYRGYKNRVNATASGYDKTVLNGTSCNITQENGSYIVKPQGRTREIYLSVMGKNTTTGESVQLKRTKYRVASLPAPTVFWGSSKNGGRASTSSNTLIAKYTAEIPLNARFQIVGWSCRIGEGAALTGNSGNISTLASRTRAMRSGTSIPIIVQVKGPDGVTQRVSGIWSK